MKLSNKNDLVYQKKKKKKSIKYENKAEILKIL